MSSSNTGEDSFGNFSWCPCVNDTINNCCIGCDKPGIGAADHNPYDNSCSDCALFCCPCAFIIDLITFPCRFYNSFCSNKCCCKKTDNN